MARAELSVRTRTERGKNEARRLRANGLVPANLIIAHSDSIALAVSTREIELFLNHNSPNTIIDLKIDEQGKEIQKAALLRGIQRDFIKHKMLHVDFEEIAMDKVIQLSIPVHLIGDPVGVMEEGGSLYQSVNEIEIECLPGDIPDHVTIDVSDLAIAHHVNISDIQVDEKITILGDADTTIATVLAPRSEEELEELEEGVGELEGEDIEPEIIGETEDEEQLPEE